MMIVLFCFPQQDKSMSEAFRCLAKILQEVQLSQKTTTHPITTIIAVASPMAATTMIATTLTNTTSTKQHYNYHLQLP
jgi:glucokinase